MLALDKVVPGKPFKPCPKFSGKVRNLLKRGAEKALALPEKLDKAIKPFRTCPIFPGKARSLPKSGAPKLSGP
jgi:hypothetical protein